MPVRESAATNFEFAVRNVGRQLSLTLRVDTRCRHRSIN
jgi:hypothetical protein